MYLVTFLKKARNDIEKAALWYADKQYDLDTRFKDNVFIALKNYNLTNIYMPPYIEG